MTSSDTTAKDSPSSTETQSQPSSQPVTAPGLRVRGAGIPFGNPFRPTPSTTTGADSSGVADPVDELEASGSTRSSSTDGAVKVDTRSLRDLARGVVLTVSQYVHSALARPDDPAEADLWLARDEDQKQIGDPIANLVGRKGLGDAAINADVANLIESAIGVAAYIVFHGQKSWSTRRAAKRLAAMNGTPTRHDTGEPA